MAQIDKALGLSYVMDMEDLYQEVLQAYLEEIPQMRQTIEATYAAKDWPAYRTQVHALKSTSLNIGAKALSEAAKECEFACKRMAGEETPGYAADSDEGDVTEREEAYIVARQAGLMALLDEVVAEVSGMVAAG